MEGHVENTTNILTIKEVADILRCSKTHAQNVIEGRVNGLPKLTHLSLGRRKVVRKQWLDEWVEANKITSDPSDQHAANESEAVWKR
jgi:hypothetical protein